MQATSITSTVQAFHHRRRQTTLEKTVFGTTSRAWLIGCIAELRP